jgi:hypothetical protein
MVEVLDLVGEFPLPDLVAGGEVLVHARSAGKS